MRTTVKQHTRRTKRKVVAVRRHARNVDGSVISSDQRKIFTGMAKQPFEVGGQLDFEKGKLDNARVHFGNDHELEFDWDPDYEVSWHTHPPVKNSSVMPSYDDLLSMRQTNENEGIIFYKNYAVSVAETAKFNKVPLKKIEAISDQMYRDWLYGMSDKKMYLKYKPILHKELGVEMSWHNPNKEIKLKSKSVDK